jgi:peptidoglycan/LPS O-acetylase OafA/YrhL
MYILGEHTPVATMQPDEAERAHRPRLEFPANLDILRAIAVLLVLLAHWLEVVGAKHRSVSFHGYDLCAGRLGVLIFFVHTSLVLNFSLTRLGTGGWVLFRTFIVRRVFRLYPLSILCVLLAFAFKVPQMPLFPPPSDRYGWGFLLSNLALTTDLTGSQPILRPLWTLSVEAQMYCALPIMFMLLGRTRSPRIALGLWVLTAALAWTQPAIAERLTAIDYAPCFVAGIVTYTLSGYFPKRLPALLWLPALMALLWSFAIGQGAAPEGSYNLPLAWVLCLALSLIIPLFNDSTTTIVNYVAHRVARYSYGI